MVVLMAGLQGGMRSCECVVRMLGFGTDCMAAV